jgi:hypothetical protein
MTQVVSLECVIEMGPDTIFGIFMLVIVILTLVIAIIHVTCLRPYNVRPVTSV